VSQMTGLPSPEETMALFKGRRSVRRYKPDPVPEQLVRQLLEAGRWAPSASNRQPWAFITVQDPTIRKQVAEHAAYYFVRWAHVAEAPLLIVMCGHRKSPAYLPFLHASSRAGPGHLLDRWAGSQGDRRHPQGPGRVGDRRPAHGRFSCQRAQGAASQTVGRHRAL
jgi:nitroreductase